MLIPVSAPQLWLLTLDEWLESDATRGALIKSAGNQCDCYATDVRQCQGCKTISLYLLDVGALDFPVQQDIYLFIIYLFIF